MQLREVPGTYRRAPCVPRCCAGSSHVGKAAAATRPVLGAARIAKFILGYAGKMHWSESDFQLVTINAAPGLLMRHPTSGKGTYSFDITNGRIRAIYVVRNHDKLRGFLERRQ